ncbi:YraN family protein [Thermoleptolyngbya sp. C42_A2020_037]|uniref:YraN family protein n=1 Tax=Thermoleptolyngbya sp. C42_A2020_037 TaxID=2747799 RepID=UPI0019E3C6E2|nr:YraN family protein [Thermoleptolyngbya sp. C42_A2020_037]MBF2083802.1 YraN family protein [Thermoleptolyngbya sp. C42_A2020_037]
MPKPAPQPVPNPRSAAAGEFGLLAEALVAQWLIQQGATILQRRWRCRWGELDLIAQLPPTAKAAATLAFVEVKARQNAGWDAGGLLAVTPQKQAKLWQAAELFLGEYPELSIGNCRFDVALVWGRSRPISPTRSAPTPHLHIPDSPIEPGQPVAIAHYTLTLQHYLPNAFSAI